VTDGNEAFVRITLEGARFAGGRLPIDAMTEVVAYQQVLRDAARIEWERENPDEDAPTGLTDGLQLVLKDIVPGSAILELERVGSIREDQASNAEELPDFTAFYERGIAELERELTLVTDPGTPVLDLPLLASPAFLNLASSLEAGESVRAESIAKSSDQAVILVPSLTEATHREVVAVRGIEYRKAIEKNRVRRRTKTESLAGKLISLNAQKRTFTFDSLHYGEVNGRYKSEAITDDLKAVLQSSALAPVVRLDGTFRFLEDQLKFILGVSSVELLEIDGKSWSRRFVELAQLTPDWSGEGGGAEIISFPALDAARQILIRADERGLALPGIFPMEDGGVQLEWSSARTVFSVEIDRDVRFTFFELRSPASESVHIESENLPVILENVERLLSGS
jgi:hypothetical protein